MEVRRIQPLGALWGTAVVLNLLTPGCCNGCSPCGSCTPCINSISLDTCKTLLWAWPIKPYTSCGSIDFTSSDYLPAQTHSGCWHTFKYCETPATEVFNDTYSYSCVTRDCTPGVTVALKGEYTIELNRWVERLLEYTVEIGSVSGKLKINVSFVETIRVSYHYKVTFKSYRKTCPGGAWVLQSTVITDSPTRAYLWSNQGFGALPTGPLDCFTADGRKYNAGGWYRRYEYVQDPWDCNCGTFTIPFDSETSGSAIDFTGAIQRLLDVILAGLYYDGSPCSRLMADAWIVTKTTMCAASSVNVTLNCRSAVGGGGGV